METKLQDAVEAEPFLVHHEGDQIQKKLLHSILDCWNNSNTIIKLSIHLFFAMFYTIILTFVLRPHRFPSVSPSSRRPKKIQSNGETPLIFAQL